MLVTSRGFSFLVERVKSISSDGQLVAVLEGGYDLTALVNSTLSILGSLADFAVDVEENYVNDGVTKQVEERVRKAITVQSEYWKL
jgi:acetoin utilization deacetylase AcuC-like enzyme